MGAKQGLGHKERFGRFQDTEVFVDARFFERRKRTLL